MPPTKATESSITIVFSWWQCIGRSFESRPHWIRVLVVSCVAHRAHRRRATGERAAAERPPRPGRARRSARPARASRLRRTTCSDSRVELEVGFEVPAGQMDVRSRLLHCGRDLRQRVRAVDQHLDRVPRTGRRVTCRPAAGRRVERALPADPRQAAPVMVADLLRDLGSEPAPGQMPQLANRQAVTVRIGLGSAQISAIARVAQRVERERDQAGGDDAEQRAGRRSDGRSWPARRRGRPPCAGCSRPRP